MGRLSGFFGSKPNTDATAARHRNSDGLPLDKRAPAFSTEIVTGPVDPSSARMTRGRFQNDAAVAFAMMGHKQFSPCLITSLRSSSGEEMQYTRPSACTFNNDSHFMG
jgi:hypothetical protein